MKTTKWEYKIDANMVLMTADLNAYGEQGWELVQVIPSGAPNDHQMDYWFKRPKTD